VNANAQDSPDLVAPPPLTELVPLETLHKLQDRFASLGQVTVCLCDPDGEPITQPTWGSHYSQLIGTSEAGRRAFHDSLRACVREPDVPVPSICHEGMTLYAALIDDDDHRRLGAIVVGTRAAEMPDEHEIYAIAAKYGIDADTLLEATAPEFAWTGGTPEAIHRNADVLADTVATIYSQARRITRQLADLHIVHGIANLLAGTSDLQRILDLTVQRVVEAMNVKACGIRLLNAETGELEIHAVHKLSEEYQGKGAVMLKDNAIDAAAFAGHIVYIEDAATDPRIRYPSNARKEGIVSGLCVPMTYRGETIGVMRLYTSTKWRFSEEQQQLASSIASQAAAAVINQRLIGAQRERDRVRRQMEAAAQIQRRMLPNRAPEHDVLTFGRVYDPSLEVGGDFYDFIHFDDGRIALAIADVVGKGLPAALLMASIRSSLHAHGARGGSAAATVSMVNNDTYRYTLISEFATLAFGTFSADGRTFTYCNAGHVPPVLLRGDRFERLEEGGPIVGVMEGTAYDEGVVSLEPGDVLVFVTDGVTEAMDFHGQQYGWDRVYASILKHRELRAQRLAQQIQWDVRRFVGLAEQADDTTIVTVKVGA